MSQTFIAIYDVKSAISSCKVKIEILLIKSFLLIKIKYFAMEFNNSEILNLISQFYTFNT